jgi:nicotinate-nucleotide adenylyltransferase
MPVWYLVPDGVVQYIEKRGLYREAATPPGRSTGFAPTARPAARPAPTSPPTPFQEVPR